MLEIFEEDVEVDGMSSKFLTAAKTSLGQKSYQNATDETDLTFFMQSEEIMAIESATMDRKH